MESNVLCQLEPFYEQTGRGSLIKRSWENKGMCVWREGGRTGDGGSVMGV